MKKGEKNKPAIMKGLSWGLFSATATLCAFFLPVFIFATLTTPIVFSSSFNEWFMIIALAIFLFCALYHSLYRIQASNHDLFLERKFFQWIVALIGIIMVLELGQFVIINF